MLFHLFLALAERDFPGANLFRYVSTRLGLATLSSLLLTFFLAPAFIRWARRSQLGEVIRDDGPESHASKRGTPTMGGTIILIALVSTTLLWCDLRNPLVWLALLVTVGYGGVGFVDDYIKVIRKNKRGLPGRVKLVALFGIGIVAAAGLLATSVLEPDVRLRLTLPLVNFDRYPISLPLALYIPLGLLVVVGASNAVNLTDGLDGLAIGPVIITSFTYCIIAWVVGTTLRSFNISAYLGMPHVGGAGELAIFCGAIGGAGIGFLWFNTHPAMVFMGDVGALSLGGAIGFVALATKTELSLPFIGGVFVVEALSVMIQVVHYKRTGRRIFLMAPIHHHFEKKGWPESRIVVRFWIISFACAILGLLVTLKVR